jgi:hypothetical protein
MRNPEDKVSKSPLPENLHFPVIMRHSARNQELTIHVNECDVFALDYMKMKYPKLIAPALASFILLAGNLKAGAAEDILANSFVDESEAATWIHWWGAPEWFLEFDPTQDADGDANSGSLKVTVNLDLDLYAGDNQFALRGSLPSVINGTEYDTLSMDIKYDPTSATRPAGDYGYFEYGVWSADDYSSSFFGNVTVTSDQEGWVHLEAPLLQTYDKIDKIAGVAVKMWAGDAVGNNHITGAQTFWIDNIKLIAKTGGTPPPDPTLSIEPAISGLNLLASKADAPYQRQNLRTKFAAYSWVGASQPITYSMTIKDFPTNVSGFQAHMFFVPGDNLPTYEASPDWNEPNVMFLQIGGNSDGTGYANLRYKVNQANGNGMYWNENPDNGPVGLLGSVGSSTVLGTWSVTFTSDTEATLTSPDGTSTAITLPDADAALFGGPMYVYYGAQPNQAANIGLPVILSGVAVTGVETPIEEAFAGPALDTTETWDVVAEDPAGVSLVPNEPSWWIAWTLPAPSFVLQSSADLMTWTDAALPAVQLGDKKKALVPMSAVRLAAPEGEEGEISPYGFFRLQKPAAP